MSLPPWLADQITAAQAAHTPVDAAFSVLVTDDNGGLVETVRTSDKGYAEKWLATSGQTGLVTRGAGQ